MLPAAHRMRRHADFVATTRDGARVRAGALVVHHQATAGPSDVPGLVGFVVGKRVGGSVVRHRVVRRLRAQSRALLGELPAGSTTVVRALPAAANARSAVLAADLQTAWKRMTTRSRP